MKGMVSNSEPLPEGTVIMAENQFAGRGQTENSWLADPGKNLTFSVVFYPSFLSLTRQFSLSMAISIGVYQALKDLLGEGTAIKWPNDIYFGSKKIGGMLIENIVSGSRIKACVAGIGINVNQEHFPAGLENRAGSICRILHQHVDLISLLAQICSHIEVAYLKLRTENYPALRQDYLSSLYQFELTAAYSQNGEIFQGKIMDVSDQGLLKLERGGEVKEYNFKEITFLHKD